MIAPSFKLEPFLTILGFFNFFRKHSDGFYKCWKRGIGLKIGPAITRIASYTTVTTNENSDHWARFRSGTDVPYHRVSIDTFFTCNQRLSSTVLSSRAHFSQQRCTNDTNKNSPGQCNPNFPIRCAANSEKMIQLVTIHRISRLQVTKCYDPARQPTRY